MEGLRTRNGNRSRSLTMSRRGRPRWPGLTYAMLTLALAVLVGALAVTSRQGPPPTIAEFAPQAVDRITDSAREASASAGADAAAQPGADLDAATGRPRDMATVDVARVRQCVGDPPRQIEDPQSPPCVPYWSGDNGGATWRGVSRDEIRVTEFGPSISPQQEKAFETFFNRRFEFYGRKLHLIQRPTPGYDSASQRAAARATYEQDQAFAATEEDYGEHYLDELARLGVVGIETGNPFPETYLATRRPYVWAQTMANDRLFAVTGNWYCARLSGGNAIHAGDPTLQLSRRNLGIIVTDGSWEGTSANPMVAELARCGDRAGHVIQSGLRFPEDGNDAVAASMENAVLQMKTSGISSVAFLGSWWHFGFAMKAATNQGYFPEWISTSYGYNDWGYALRIVGTPEQLKSLMALSALPMDRKPADHPSNWALEEVTGRPQDNTQGAHQNNVDAAYRMLLLLASGIQMAGPNLTAETFERGLHKARFPNPPHRIMAGSVGFTDGDHTMTDDVAEMWWNNTQRPPYPGAFDAMGTYCYLDHGSRRKLGEFPSGDPFFTGECDVGL